MDKTVKSENPTSNHTIRYAVSGGYPPVEARLQIDRSGQAEMFIGSSWSLPVENEQEQDGRAQVGVFGGMLDEQTRTSLSALAQTVLGTDIQASAGVPDSVFRLLELSFEGQETRIELAGASSSPAMDALEAALKEIMVALADQPRQAVRITLWIEPDEQDASQLKPGLILTNKGSQPVQVLFQNPSAPGQPAFVNLSLEEAIVLTKDFTAWNPIKTIQFPPNQLAPLLPAGMVRVGVKGSYTLSLPAFARPAPGKAVHASAQMTFWLAGQAVKGQQVQVRTARIALGSI